MSERERARVVIVDDEPANVALLRSLLRKVGFETVESTTDAREAVDLVTRFEPDLILLDLHMPHLTGYDVLQQLENVIKGPTSVPVLVLTADITDDARQRALALGARDFISKPFRLGELVLRIGNLVDARMSEQGMARDLARLQSRVDGDTRYGPAEEHREMHRRIESTIADHAIAIVFQPMIDLKTGNVAAVEALARFPRPPIEGPGVWFRQANEVGLGVHLELAAAEIAIESLPGLGEHVRLAINVSEDTLRSPALLDILARSQPDRFILELHESQEASDLDELARLTARIQGLGIRVAVDELGRGSVGFERLLALRADYVKIDRVLIEGINVDAGRRALMAGMVAFGREIGAVVVAEGIETEAELRTVADLGVGLAQGFYLGRPQPLPDLSETARA